MHNLQHAQPNNAVFDLAALESGPRDPFERRPVLLLIADSWPSRFETRLPAAPLFGWSDRQNEGDALSASGFGLWRNPNALRRYSDRECGIELRLQAVGELRRCAWRDFRPARPLTAAGYFFLVVGSGCHVPIVRLGAAAITLGFSFFGFLVSRLPLC
jgi:hypothetical protein